MSKMTVKEILLETAQTLGLEKAVAYLQGTGQDATQTESLLRCFHTVENELALDYLPLYAETEVSTETGAIAYEELPHDVVRVLRVKDEHGVALAYKLFPNYLKTDSGNVTVSYTYAPTKKTIDGVSDFELQASARLFVYGIAAEYTLTEGDFENAGVWDKKYKDAIAAAYRSKPCRILRSRRWA